VSFGWLGVLAPPPPLNPNKAALLSLLILAFALGLSSRSSNSSKLSLPHGSVDDLNFYLLYPNVSYFLLVLLPPKPYPKSSLLSFY